MIKKFCAIATIVQLAACGNPVIDINGNYIGNGSGGGTDGALAGVPQELSSDLGAVEYDPVNETLKVTLLPFDGSPQEASYIRVDAEDIDGFQAYELQENRSSRKYTGLFQARNHSSAGAVATNFDLENQFGGATYSRDTEYSAPTSGIATYRGTYAGVQTTTNTATGVGPNRVSGDVLLNVDFNQARVEGEVVNMQVVDGGAALQDVTMVQTAVDSGVFYGEVRGPGGNGNYGGNLAGPNADEAAGVLVFDRPGDIQEYGAFVLPQTCISSPAINCP